MLVKTTVDYHLTSVKMATLKGEDCWRESKKHVSWGKTKGYSCPEEAICV